MVEIISGLKVLKDETYFSFTNLFDNKVSITRGMGIGEDTPLNPWLKQFPKNILL